MKRIIAILLTVTLLMSLAACGTNSAAPTDPKGDSVVAQNPSNVKNDNAEPVRIAVGFRTGIDIPAAKALFEKLADAYNVEFLYSEQIKDITAELDFIDNAASYGCKAYLSWVVNNPEQIASVCENYEMYYVTHTQWNKKWNDSSNYWVGTCGFANPPKAEMYKEMLATFLADSSGNEGILVTSGLACNGNLQHIETTTATLEAIAQYYGLKFEQSIDELAVVKSGTNAVNDKNVDIYILPGTTSTEGYTTQLGSLLGSGDYTILASYTVTTDIVNVVLESEEVCGKNIIVGGIAVISDALKTIFAAKDQFGNNPVDYMSMQYSSITQAGMFAMVYNAINGYADVYKTAEGKTQGFGCGQVTISDTINSLAYCDLDIADNADSIVATVEWVDTLIAKDASYTIDTWTENFVNANCEKLAEEAIARIS